MPDETAASISSGPPRLEQGGSTDAVESALVRQDEAPGSKLAAQKLFHGESKLSGLPMQLDVAVPVPKFRVEDLLALEKGAVIETRWPHTDDVPVWCGGAQLVWTEFEVLGQKLAVRVTRLG